MGLIIHSKITAQVYITANTGGRTRESSLESKLMRALQTLNQPRRLQNTFIIPVQTPGQQRSRGSRSPPLPLLWLPSLLLHYLREEEQVVIKNKQVK